MERKYTKGAWIGRDSAGRFLADNPWSAEHESADDFMSAPIHANGKVIALLVQENAQSPYVDYSEIDANARLIAAAPDLLDALQVLFDSYKQLADSGDSGFWKLEEQPEGQQALAAIAKATGEQE